MLTNERHTGFSAIRSLLILVMAVLVIAGCSNMEEQPKLDEPYQSSQTFGRAARELLPEAVPVGFERADDHFYAGIVDGEWAAEFPIEITAEVLAQGQKRYNEFCSVCHGLDGYGEGVISLEGFPQPASYHTDLLRSAPVGYLYAVITEGRGTMFSYASRIEPSDRWAIVAYIRALQLSQNAPVESLPEDAQDELAVLDQGQG